MRRESPGRHRVFSREKLWTLALTAALVSLSASCGRGTAGHATNFYAGLSGGPESPVATWGGKGSFGSIDGFALLHPGVAVVSDATDGHLDLLVDGKRVAVFGRVGVDPGDFTTLGAVAAVRADTFVVLDPNRGRLIAFHRVADSVMRVGPVDLPFRVSGVCSLADHLFVLGRYDSTLVHETTTHGGVVRSFGRLEGATPFEIGLNAAAEIACSSEAGAVAIASRVPGELRIFGVSGTLLRRDSIPSFTRLAYEHRGPSTRALPAATGHWDTVEHLQWFGRNLLVQLRPNPEKVVSTFESRWLSATGEWRMGLPSWPKVLAHTASGRVYVAETDPHRAVRVYQVLR